METNKVIAYSLLAQIRNSGNFINSSVEIFVPIVKYALYKEEFYKLKYCSTVVYMVPRA